MVYHRGVGFTPSEALRRDEGGNYLARRRMVPAENKCRICSSTIKMQNRRSELFRNPSESEELSEFCDNCHGIIWQIKELLIEPYIKNQISPEAGNFLLEVDFLFLRTSRVQAYFNFAWEVWLEFAAMDRDKLPLDKVRSLKSTQLPQENLIEMLTSIQMIEIKGEDVLPGRLVRRGLQIRLEGRSLIDPKWAQAVRQARAIICLALTLELLEKQTFVPQEIMSLFELLEQHRLVCNEEKKEKVAKRIPAGRVSLILNKHIGRRQQFKMICNMMGLNLNENRIIADLQKWDTETGTADWLLRSQTVRYLEYVRNRMRYRIRKRVQAGEGGTGAHNERV